MSRPFNESKAMEIYRFMIEFQMNTYGFSPTLREIGFAFNYKSHTALLPYIDWLESKGYIKKRGRQIRALKQTERMDYGIVAEGN